jgi:hypothetical protein
MGDIEAIGRTAVIASRPAMRKPNASSRPCVQQKG